MAITGNKGEWSEIYAFLKILSDKVLYSADEKLILDPQAFINVLSVMRQEKANLIYEIDREKNQINIKEKNNILFSIPIKKISSKLLNILNKIKNSKGTFELPEAEDLMNELRTKDLKAGARKKADIYITIEDPITGKHPTKGFSIKSQLGGKSTLLNASKHTNIEYEIVQAIDQSIRHKKPLIGLSEKLTNNETLRFSAIDKPAFEKNLMMIDSRMPLIIAEMVKAYYLREAGSTVKELTEYLKKSNPLRLELPKHFYEYKVQELLMAVAFGMKPSKEWIGDYEAHGGYIIVKQDGALACYHIYDRDQFKEFLYENTKLDTPDLPKHGFGTVYSKDGTKFIKLNLQIRFTS